MASFKKKVETSLSGHKELTLAIQACQYVLDTYRKVIDREHLMLQTLSDFCEGNSETDSGALLLKMQHFAVSLEEEQTKMVASRESHGTKLSLLLDKKKALDVEKKAFDKADKKYTTAKQKVEKNKNPDKAGGLETSMKAAEDERRQSETFYQKMEEETNEFSKRTVQEVMTEESEIMESYHRASLGYAEARKAALYTLLGRDVPATSAPAKVAEPVSDPVSEPEPVSDPVSEPEPKKEEPKKEEPTKEEPKKEEPKKEPEPVVVAPEPEAEPEDSDSEPGGVPVSCKAKVLSDFEPGDADELALKEGDIVDITFKHDDGWWEGTINGKSGLVPSSYVEEL